VKLSEYVAKEAKRVGTNKTTILKELAQKSGVSLLTLQTAERGATMRMYDKAKAVSDATDGKVKVSDLCEV
jgi:hypothetical protein